MVIKPSFWFLALNTNTGGGGSGKGHGAPLGGCRCRETMEGCRHEAEGGWIGATVGLSHQHGAAPPAHSLGHYNKEGGIFLFY